MRKWMVYLGLIFTSSISAQVNLVPNPSFESLDSCPYLDQQVHFASPWYDLSNSPDLYNTCASTFNNTVPNNWTGYQWPRTGNGYAGVAIYNYYNGSGDEMRDYIAVPLLDTLAAGKKYCVEFYVSRSDYTYYAINRIGLYFANEIMPYDGMGDTIDVYPQVQFDTNTFLTDTMNWVRIHGVYQALGGEVCLAIGNFFSDVETDTIGGLGFTIAAYYYIDDVSVYELQNCDAGSDVSVCYKDSVQLGGSSRPSVTYTWSPTTGLSDTNTANPKAAPEITTTYYLTQTECDVVLYDTVMITVNQDCHSASSIIIPSMIVGSQEFFITGLESNSRLELYDVRGRLIYRNDHYENDFWTTSLSQGIYVARLTRPNGEPISQKVCVIRN